jgi:CO/xanthine dehydrogenase Mo-binding subunit
MPYSKPLKARSGAAITYDSGDYLASQAQVLAAAGWDAFPKRQEECRKQGRYIGIGLAHAIKGTGRGPFETGIVRINPSGRVSVYTGATAMGQGLGTALAQICADQLGLQPDQVVVRSGDTALSPLGLGGFASRQLVTAGSSVLLSSRAVAAKAKRLASHILEVAEEDLELAEGKVRVVGVPDLCVTLGELSRILRGAPGYAFPPGIEPALEADIKWQTEPLAYANTCHVVEVEVDPDLCRVTILRYVALQDCGILVNPMIVEGQIRGGIVHGIGNALLEEMVYDGAHHDLGGLPLADIDRCAEYRDHLSANALTDEPARRQGCRRSRYHSGSGRHYLCNRGRFVSVQHPDQSNACHPAGDVQAPPGGTQPIVSVAATHGARAGSKRKLCSTVQASISISVHQPQPLIAQANSCILPI